jgi:uncharacterized membrane protein YedE/YeeE
MKTLITAALSGVSFALGLTISGMTIPTRVLGFLDVTGAWNPALAFVMLGAIAVYAPLFRLITRAKAPRAKFELPTNTRIDAKLLTGAIIFGVGWGLAGMCPGPAIVTLGSFAPEAWVFGAGLVLGALAFRLYQAIGAKRDQHTRIVLTPVKDG